MTENEIKRKGFDSLGKMLKLTSEEKRSIVDNNLLLITHGEFHIDIIKLDNLLHQRHGDYEKELKISMQELIIKEYGEETANLVERLL